MHLSDHNMTKLEINQKKKFGKTTNTQRLKNILLNNGWVKQEIRKEIKYMKTNENENTTVQNLWDEVKMDLTGIVYCSIQYIVIGIVYQQRHITGSKKIFKYTN